MTAPRVLGTASDRNIEVHLPGLIGSHACIVANAGGGKSGLIRRLLEVTSGDVQHIVLDVEDEFYTLRQAYPYVILGGDNGDAPITVDGARDLALTVLRTGMSAVIQLNHLHANDQEGFIGAFIDAMMEAPRDLWHPVLVVLDEAHRLVPQDGETGCSAAVKDLVSRGRKRGFTAVLATQRMAKIDKNVTGDVNNWFLGRVGQATDRRVACDNLGFSPSSEDGRSLQTMPNRTFWCFGPAVTQVPTQFRVADTQTTILEAGGAAVPTPPAPKELQAILAGIAEAAAKAEAEKKAAERASSPARADAPDIDIEAIRAAAYADGDDAGYTRAYKIVREAFSDLTVALDEARPLPVDKAAAEKRPPLEISVLDRPAPEDEPPFTLAKMSDGYVGLKIEEVRRIPTSPEPEKAFKLTPAKKKLLDAVAFWNALGFDPVNRRHACVVMGLSPKASTFGVYVGELVGAGALETAGPGLIRLTAMGKATAQHYAKPDVKEIVRMAKSLLTPAEQKVFDAICAVYPRDISRGDLADVVGLSRTASTLGVYIGKIAGFGFVTTSPGRVKAEAFLFGK